MRRKDSRQLTPEEVNLWKRVTQKTRALHSDVPEPAKSQTSQKSSIEPDRCETQRPELQSIPKFRIGERCGFDGPSYDLAPKVSQHLKTHPLRLDRKTYDKLRRGKMAPEARIDLHGMTTARALPELRRFVQEAHSTGCRLILVITGKGRNSVSDDLLPVREGVLKSQVPRWLSVSPLSQLVLDVSEAHPRHGGSGAYYVYLRRRK